MKYKFKIGDLVRMTESFKDKMCNPCKDAGKHLGPFPDPELSDDCWGCSTAHIQEFENCIGEVIGYPFPDYDDVDVRWLPHNLRYCYGSDELELV